MTPKILKSKKANMGMTIFLAVITFNIFMYIVIYSANADSSVSDVIGSGNNLDYNINASTTEELSTTGVTSWYSGFDVSVFNMPWWINIFYVTFQGLLITISIYSMIRGL